MAHFIAAMVIGIGCLYALYHLAMVLYFLAFGDEGFTWTGMAYAGISATVLALAGFAAYGIGTLILSAF